MIERNFKTFLRYAGIGFFAWGILGGIATVANLPIPGDISAQQKEEINIYASIYFNGGFLWALCGLFIGILLFITDQRISSAFVVIVGAFLGGFIGNWFFQNIEPPSIVTMRAPTTRVVISAVFAVLATISVLALRFFTGGGISPMRRW